ncbi:MAG: hypothetical protein ABI557_02995 [Aureliella sp.]
MSQNTPKQWFNLEERFFNDIDNKLLAKLRDEMSSEQTAQEIMRLTGISNEKLAAEIVATDVTVETLAAFRLVPLIAVAWADDRMEENERYTIQVAAEKAGIVQDSASMELIQAWTQRRPPAELLQTWCDYARVLAASLAGEHRKTLQQEVDQQVSSVAHASGGVLGFGSVSSSEQAVIDQIHEALS